MKVSSGGRGADPDGFDSLESGKRTSAAKAARYGGGRGTAEAVPLSRAQGTRVRRFDERRSRDAEAGGE
jgi:hypothetical protein